MDQRSHHATSREGLRPFRTKKNRIMVKEAQNSNINKMREGCRPPFMQVRGSHTRGPETGPPVVFLFYFLNFFLIFF